MSSKLKPSNVSLRRNLKEKVVQMYEDLFHGVDPATNNPRYWEDLFLLKPKMSALEAEISKWPSDQLISVKENINTLFTKCIECLNQDNSIKIVNSLMTLCGLVRGLYKKMQGDYGFDFINILIGFDTAEKKMKILIEHCSNFLIGDYIDHIRSLTLKFLLLLVTGTDNMNQNTVLEYFTINCNFEAVTQLLSNSEFRSQHGSEIVLFLTMMVNYRKYEMTNPYTVQLSLLDDELCLNGYGQVITASLSEFNRKYSNQLSEHSGSGWLASLTSMVGSMFVSEEIAARNEQIKANDAFLLALYEAVHLNRNFITALITATESISSKTASFCAEIAKSANISVEIGKSANFHADSAGKLAEFGKNTSVIDDMGSTEASVETAEEHKLAEIDVNAQPTNLLVTFLEYCSIVMQDTKTEESFHNVKLCFVILTCISEDQYCNLLLHDANLVYNVVIHKLPMRHRKIVNEKCGPSRPLACAILDLMVEFIMSHMMKKLPIELFTESIAIIQRLLVYQKRNSVRLNYNWRDLWAALIALGKFLVASEANLAKKMNIFHLAYQVMNIFNLFITYGDAFLSTPSSYDELYYEVMRMHQVFENLYSVSLRYSRTEGEYKESAQRLMGSLANIRAIIYHFTPKIDKWSQENGVSSLTEEQVLEAVRSNYESLTLKLHDSLDQYQKYAEAPYHTNFFCNMVKNIICDTRQGINFALFESSSVLLEISQM